MELQYPTSIRYLLISAFGFIFTSLSYLIYIYHPSEMIISTLTAFTPSSIIYRLWQTPPYNVFVKIYIFNVTNPKEFLSGSEKLRVQEVGPYVYREVMYNINTTFNNNGTITFIPKRRLEFVRELSIGHVHEDTLMLPNVPLLGITSSLVESSMFTNLAVTSVSSYLGSQPFLELTIDEYLMGYDDPLVTLANSVVPNWIDFPRFGILDRIMAMDNSSELVNMVIESDVNSPNNDNLTDGDMLIYTVERWGGSRGLSHWGYEDGAGCPTNNGCNTVEGSLMGSLFPPNMKKGQSMKLFRRAFCRTIPFIYYNSTYSADGFEGYTFKTDPGFLLPKENNSENFCYCQKPNPEDCPPSGIGNLSPCYYGIPVTMSLPHFLNTDSSVSEKIEGMLPEAEKHELVLTVHPKLGVPLEFHLRIQINLMVPETKYNSKTKPFNNHNVPLFWIDLTVDEVPHQVKLFITLLYHVLPVVEQVLLYSFAIVGVLLLCPSSLLAFLFLGRQRDYMGIKVQYNSIPLIVLKQKQLQAIVPC